MTLLYAASIPGNRSESTENHLSRLMMLPEEYILCASVQKNQHFYLKRSGTKPLSRLGTLLSSSI